jgi:hypothetical protein
MKPEFGVPSRGDVVIVKKSNWYALADGGKLLVVPAFWENKICMSPTHQIDCFWGPSNGAPREGVENHMSCSGGPFISLTPANQFRKIGTTIRQFWHWKEYPCAGGGQTYDAEVTLWELAELTPEKS